ncbi:hypothetical protein EAN97_20735 [Klebsiella pneumoniae]|nr:hypothetical protein EAN97_20735 [Klebsiella pneumoniae]
MNRIEVQLFVSFAQKQNFSPRRHVVPADWFWIIGDIPLSFFCKISRILRVSVIGQIVRTWLPPVFRLKV